MSIKTDRMLKIDEITQSEIEDKNELYELAEEAKKYLLSQQWCSLINEGWLDRGWGNLIAVFYFDLEASTTIAPNSIWVIVGDLPPAYIDTQDNPNGACAIEAYVREMQKWIDNVSKGKPVDDLIPINVPPELKYAKMLQARLKLIREEILSCYQDELNDVRGA